MNYRELKKQWLAEEKAVFQGWDFSYLSNRWESEPCHWDYDAIVRRYLKNDDMLLDMGTGGGEYLLSLNHLPSLTFATEGYLPNFELCQKTLKPLGIDVRHFFNDSDLPFDNKMFDIIINRHESFDMSEVNRLLKPNGLFITQQVGSKNNRELIQALAPQSVMPYADHTLANNIKSVESNDFEIIFQGEDFTKTCFLDVGAIVYYAKIIEWEFQGFSVENYFEELCQLQSLIEKKGDIKSTEHRFIIVARKFN